MQKQLLKATMLSLVVALTITSAVAPAAAYASGSIKFDVPFEFTAGHGVFPAGKYTIRLDGVSPGGVMQITTSGLINSIGAKS